MESAEGGWGSLLDVGKAVNLILVMTVVVWVARKPLANFFAGRSQAIRDQLAEAQKARLEAETRLAEIHSRMSSLEEELLEIRAVAEREARQEHQRLIADAERDAQKIMERARREIEGMTRTAQLELRAHVAELSVRLARQKIQTEMTADDHRRLFARFVAGLGGKE
jgi:F-type H+-transporting ATPase subunit b